MVRKVLTPDEQKAPVGHLVSHHKLIVRRTCKAINISRSTYQYKVKNKDEDIQIIQLLTEWVDKHPAIGFWKCYPTYEGGAIIGAINGITEFTCR